MSNKLVQRMCLMFGPPETDQPAEWFAEMDRLLKGYGVAELDKAADIVLRTHKGTRFPSISEMLSACADAREDTRPRERPMDVFPDWTPEAIKKADELIQCKLGQRAADEGWVFALHTFCRKKGRLPLTNEVGDCIAEARGFDEAYARNAKSGEPLQLALNKLGDSMLRMRAYLGEIAYGRVRSDSEVRAYLREPKSFFKREAAE